MRLYGGKDIQSVKSARWIKHPELKAHVLRPLEVNNEEYKTIIHTYIVNIRVKGACYVLL